MKKLSFLIVLLCVSGCFSTTPTRQKTNELKLGMSPQAVANILGDPDSSSAEQGQGSCYMYSMWKDFWNRRPGDYSDRYYTCFKDDKLISYGRVGDPRS